MVGLIDVDGTSFPNLALMKISAWHKSIGDEVEFVKPGKSYDIIYMSKVFTFTPDYSGELCASQIVKGGTGYNLKSELPSHIEHVYPDYDLYGVKDTAYGFLSRGCPRRCDFCIVGEKEGNCSVKVANLDEFWRGQKNIVLLDPNITACNDFNDLISQLEASDALVDINQGLDARLLTDDKILRLMRLRIKMVHFALDNYKDLDLVISKLTRVKEITNWSKQKVSVFVLTNFNTTIQQDLERIYRIKELRFSPYVMIYDKQNAPQIVRRLQRYVNNRFFFWSPKYQNFEEYLKANYKTF